MPSEKSRSESVPRRAGCGKSARPDPWGARSGNRPGLPDLGARPDPKRVFPGQRGRRFLESGDDRRLERLRLHGIRAKLFHMKRVNVTLAIEEDLLQEARAVAARSLPR